MATTVDDDGALLFFTTSAVAGMSCIVQIVVNDSYAQKLSTID